MPTTHQAGSLIKKPVVNNGPPGRGLPKIFHHISLDQLLKINSSNKSTSIFFLNYQAERWKSVFGNRLENVKVVQNEMSDFDKAQSKHYFN